MSISFKSLYLLTKSYLTRCTGQQGSQYDLEYEHTIDWYLVRWKTLGKCTHESNCDGDSALLGLSSLLNTPLLSVRQPEKELDVSHTPIDQHIIDEHINDEHINDEHIDQILRVVKS